MNQLLKENLGEKIAQQYISRIHSICNYNFLFLMGIAKNIELAEVTEIPLLPAEVFVKIASYLDLSRDIQDPKPSSEVSKSKSKAQESHLCK